VKTRLIFVGLAIVGLLVSTVTANPPVYQAKTYQNHDYYYPPSTSILAIFVPQPEYTVGLSYSDPITNEKLDLLLQKVDSLERQRVVAQPEKVSHLATCTKCHSGDNPKGGFVVNGNMSTKDMVKASRAIFSGAMPPKGGLEMSEREKAVEELLSSKK
jgi:hypothetical protein